MKYMMLIYANHSQAPQFTLEEHQAAVQAWVTFATEAEAAGVLVSNDGLYPVTDATTVRVRNGRTLTTDGPFAETHEQLGGYYILDCQDLDEAIGWAAKMPGAQYGSIEVRPVMTYTQEYQRQVRDDRSGTDRNDLPRRTRACSGGTNQPVW